MRFVAIDVETANADMASICSIGAATFQEGRLAEEWYSLVDPNDYFDPVNVSIHGIDEDQVAGAPSFADVSPELLARVGDAVAVTHSHFDRVALHQAAADWGLPPPPFKWLDSAMVARRAWEDCARRGYGLADVCRRIGYEFQHHHALEDAKAAGHILLTAMAQTGLDLDAMLKWVRQPIWATAGGGAAIRRDGNPDGPLAGEVIVFTGSLAIPRREAADLAASVGCEVASGVTKKTTLLVVGDMDVKKLAGHQKSSKHRKAEDLAAQGFPLRIIRETDFRELAALA
jgi:DNA polymerase III subunit epsilon